MGRMLWGNNGMGMAHPSESSSDADECAADTCNDGANNASSNETDTEPSVPSPPVEVQDKGKKTNSQDELLSSAVITSIKHEEGSGALALKSYMEDASDEGRVVGQGLSLASTRSSVPGAYAEGSTAPHQERIRPAHQPSQLSTPATALQEGEGLAQANPVESSHFQTAEPVDLEAQDMEKQEKKQRGKKGNLLLLLVGFTLLVSAVVVLVIGLLKNRNNQSQPTEAPTAPSPTAIGTVSPTLALTDSFHLLLESLPAFHLLLESLPEYTLESLTNSSSPQWKALMWLENHPQLPHLPEWKKQQLFALTTFYYAMQGPQWPQPVAENWLLYEESECLWFSGRYGSVVAGSYQAEKSYDRFGIGAPCNLEEVFQVLILFRLTPQQKPRIPPELGLLTQLSYLSLPRNNFNSSIADFWPTELYDMLPNLEFLNLHTNQLVGSIPSELGRMEHLQDLILTNNALSGSLPSELGTMSSLKWIHLGKNALTGLLPTEMAQCTKMEILNLGDNGLSGPIPSALASMSNLYKLFLPNNKLTGALPASLFGQMKNLTFLKLENNTMTGTIPEELGALAIHGSLAAATLRNNSFTGTIPDGLCSLGLYNSSLQIGLEFDCCPDLCGCCWCPCPDSNGTELEDSCSSMDPHIADPFVPSRDDLEWPGEFPTANGSLTINIHTDNHPDETTMEWSILDMESGEWKVLDVQTCSMANAITSYTQEVQSNAQYRLQLMDSYNDGNCCGRGLGWFTLTDSMPSQEQHSEGTVVWEAPGYVLKSSLDVFVWVDGTGHAEVRQDGPPLAEGAALALQSRSGNPFDLP